MSLLNLTPHAIVVRMGDGTSITFEPSGQIARVSVTQEVVGDHNGIPVVKNQTGAVTGLVAGADCIVSGMVLAALPAGTLHVYAPDTGATAVRNDLGHIIAVTRLLMA